MASNDSKKNIGIKIAVIGGGTGNYTVLTALKPLVGKGLSAIVNMVDDGGSTGKLRDAQGVLPAGDARQCLAALSNAPELRDLFNIRFSGQVGVEAGHSFGNLFFLAAEKLTGDYRGALALASRQLNITGQVIPVTFDNRRLIVTLPDGRVIRGQHQADIDTSPSFKGATISFDGPTDISPEAEAAIKESDLTVIAPGDLYTSIAPALAVRGMREALCETKVVQVVNLMNRVSQTVGFSVSDHAAEVERIVGEPVLDYVLYNVVKPSSSAARVYMREGELGVDFDTGRLQKAHYQAIGRDLLSEQPVTIDPADSLGDHRSLIRHDPTRLGDAIMAIRHSA